MPDTASTTAAPPQEAALLAQAEEAVRTARQAGAGDVEASVSWGRSVDFRWRDGQLEEVKESASRSLGVALYVDGRYSAHRTNDLDPARLEAFLQEAVALTRALEPDPFRKITDPALYAGRSDADLDLVDPALAAVSRDQRLGWCRTLAERAGDHEDVVSATSYVHTGEGVAARATSNGFSGTHASTSAALAASVTLREGETKRPEDHWYASATHLEDLPEAGSIGEEALRRALARRGAAKVASGRATMIVEPRAAQMLIGRLLGAMTAGAVQQRRSFLAEARGERVAAPLLHLTDDPLLQRASGSRHYDGEGIAAKPLAVVADGVLEHFYVDTYYGRKLDWSPTTGSPSNLVLRLGDEDLDALVARTANGILVSSWLGGNADLTTGDFSFGLRGHAVHEGKRAQPVGEMNVTGTYRDLLGRLAAVGNDPLPWSTCRTPTLVFDDIEFSGA